MFGRDVISAYKSQFDRDGVKTMPALKVGKILDKHYLKLGSWVSKPQASAPLFVILEDVLSNSTFGGKGEPTLSWAL